MKKIIIFGATSAIAQATAHRYAKRGARFYLLARDPEKLAAVAADLIARGANAAHTATFEANDIEAHTAAIDTAIDTLDGFDIALIAHGTLGNQRECETSVALTLQEFGTNAFSVIALLTRLANYCELQRYGTLAVVGSVAGDRGRQSNYVCGAAKGALAIFLQGLRNRLYHSGVHVLTIKPGFIDTPMTAGMRKGALWASPARAGAAIESAITRRRNVAYVPGWWGAIMFVVRAIPEALFKRMKL